MKQVSRIVTLTFIIFIFSASAALADDRICVTRYVPDWFPTIQECIDASYDCDTCLVSPGVYVENIDFQGKAITVKGDYFEYQPVIDGNQNGSVVTFSSGEMEESVLDGFTIRNGSGTYFPGEDRYKGGGFFCDWDTRPTITNCTITGNDATHGGGIDCYDALITNCTISGNSAEVGGGIDTRSSPIVNCTISGNSAEVGGGICTEGSPIANCTITNNLGGGILATFSTIEHCTISENIAGTGLAGGITRGNFYFGGQLTIMNCILWGNLGHLASEIALPDKFPTEPHLTTVSYSDVQGGEAAVYVGGGGSTLDWGSGNIDANPSFVGGGDYHLSSWSPCIDTGTDAGVYDDIDGDVRPIGAGFDMGSDEAPEFQPIIFDLRAYYAAGRLSLDYTIGTPVAAMWANYLILTAPAVQVIPLWTISLPAIYPPMEIPISIPFPVMGTIGIWTALFDEYGSQTMKLEWVDTGGGDAIECRAGLG